MAKKDEMIVIDMARLLRTLWHRAWMVLLAMAVCAAVTLGYTAFFAAPQYTSSVLMYVSSSVDRKQSITQGELTAAQSLVDTYTVILFSRATLNSVIEEAELTCSYEQLFDRISAEAVNGTEVLRIHVTHPDPEEAARMANAIARVLPEKIDAIVEGSSARVVDLAEIPEKPSSPKTGRNVAVSLLLGMLASVGGILARELLDDRIRDPEQLTRGYDQPLLAQIPDGTDDLNQSAKEAWRLLRTNLNFRLPDVAGCRIIGITSTLRGEGKSAASIQIARTMALTGQRVLLLEADMRQPVAARRLGCEAAPGLSDLLLDRCSEAAALQQAEGSKNLWIITAGDIPGSPGELVDSNQMAVTIKAMAACFGVIIVDLPPVTAASDALAASRLLSGMVVVVGKGVCTRSGLEETLRQLKLTGCPLLGFVMTNENTDRKCNAAWRQKKNEREYC